MKRVALLLVVLLAACAPRLGGYGEIATTPRLADGVMIARDGTPIALRAWPAAEPAGEIAVFIALHGFNDYSRTFETAAPAWAESGITTYAIDQRGFGETPQRGIWPGAAAMVADIETLCALVRARHPGVPLFLVGNSMGGAAAIHSAVAARLPVDGIILSAPAVWGWSELDFSYRAALWLAAHTVPSLTLTGRGLDIMPSDNIEMLRALGADPLVIKETRVDAIYGLVDLMEAAYQDAGKLEAPVLLLYGARDQVVPPEPIEALRGKLSGPLTVRIYDDGYHMLLRGLTAPEIWADIAAWAGERAGRAAAYAEGRGTENLHPEDAASAPEDGAKQRLGAAVTTD